MGYKSHRIEWAQPQRVALSFEKPKLTAIATSSMDGTSFSALLDKAIERSGRMREVKQIELSAEPSDDTASAMP